MKRKMQNDASCKANGVEGVRDGVRNIGGHAQSENIRSLQFPPGIFQLYAGR